MPDYDPKPINPNHEMGGGSAPVEKKQSNLKKIAGYGCLGILVLGALFVVSVSALVEVMMRSSDVYQAAFQRAQNDSRVTAKLGSPLKKEILTKGQVQTYGPQGDAELAIPISGPRGKGTILVSAKRSAGEWKLKFLQVAIDGEAHRIDLLNAAEPAKTF